MSESEPYGGSADAAGQAQPGWYPTGDGWQRYWDGAQWTEHSAPLVAATPQAYQGQVSSSDTGMAVFAHLGGAFLSFIVPLVIYFIKRDESPFVRHHAAEALNFHFTLFLASIVCVILIFVIIGIFLLLALVVASWVLTIIAAVAANKGEWYRYPATIRIIS